MTPDSSLYRGSAAHYASGRIAYPHALVEGLIEAVPLTGQQRLLDLGCGPGSLTLLLAPHLHEAIGLDADRDMLAEAKALAARANLTNCRWIVGRAEDTLTDGLGLFDLVTLGQSFHWMDRRLVAGLLFERVRVGGALAHLHATTHQGGDEDPGELPHPVPPRSAIDELVIEYLGTRRRAGQGFRALPSEASDEVGVTESQIYAAAGFVDRQRFAVPGRRVVRTAAQIASGVYSLSWSAPHLFGDRLPEFDGRLRALLAQAGPEGLFWEQAREIVVDVWRRPA